MSSGQYLYILCRASVAEWLGHQSHTTRSLPSSQRRFESSSDRSEREKICQFTYKHVPMIGGLSQNTLYMYNVSEFSIPPIKTDRHHVNAKLKRKYHAWGD
jgi:hypothetical protein